MKNAILWDVTPCGSRENLCFEGAHHTIIRAKRISDLGKKLAVSSNSSHIPEDGNLLLDESSKETYFK
jgi:hypothetical protein